MLQLENLNQNNITPPKEYTHLEIAQLIKDELMDSNDDTLAGEALLNLSFDQIDALLLQINTLVESYKNNGITSDLLEAIPEFVKPIIFKHLPELKNTSNESEQIITDKEALNLRSDFNKLIEKYINILQNVNKALREVASGLTSEPTALELYGAIYKQKQKEESTEVKLFLQDFNSQLGEKNETFKQLTPEQIKEFIKSFIA